MKSNLKTFRTYANFSILEKLIIKFQKVKHHKLKAS